eukprot:g26738.t1
MVRIQSGDATAFDELVRLYQGPLVGFFYRNSRDMQLSEDLTQETLLRIFNQAWDYLPGGRFRAWMYRIARNLLIDNVRRQSHDALVKAVKATPNTEDDYLGRLAGEILPPGETASYRELAELVDEMLAEIPEEQRMTFVLHHVSGLTLSEVADAMDTTLPTSKSRLRLAREKLSEKLQRRGVIISEMEEGLAGARRTVNTAAQSEARIREELNELQGQLAGLQEEARKAVAAGDDNAARLSLVRKQEAEDLIAGLEQQHQAASATLEHLSTTQRALEARLSDARRKLAQLNVAEPEGAVAETSTPPGSIPAAPSDPRARRIEDELEALKRELNSGSG